MPLLLILLIACIHKQEEIRTIESQGKILAIELPQSYIGGLDKSRLQVQLEGSSTPILGSFEAQGGGLRFVPIVPFTPGMTYVIRYVWQKGEVEVGRITLPVSKSPPPELLSIYPLQDTVPENLLKVYLRFSAPMMEGRSASLVHLLKDGRDTMKGTFLDLQPELWNPDGTILTLWLDPGRIKLDLIPNRELGNPLTRGYRYELVVGEGWRSKDGIEMNKSVRKSFVVGTRDDTSPSIDQWLLVLPASTTKEALHVRFGEGLDRMLAEETIFVLDRERKAVAGTYEILGEDSMLAFIPDKPWTKGDYILSVESRLEDLSGNNLNRLFETDLAKSDARKETRSVYERSFSIK